MARSASTELEARLLGMCMVYPETASRVVSLLRPEMFVAKEHRLVCEAIHFLLSAGKTPSSVAVLLELDRRKQAVDRGSVERLLEYSSVPTDVEATVEALREAYARRMMAQAARELADAAEAEADFDALGQLASERVIRLLQAFQQAQEPVRHVREVLADVALSVTDPSLGHRRRLPFGFFVSLGRVLRGLEATRLYVVAGRPSMGKTALGLQLATGAIEHGRARAVLVFSLEMDAQAVGDRLVRMRTGINPADAAELAQEKRQRILQMLDPHLMALSEEPLWICDRRDLRVTDISVIARRVAVETGGLDLIVIDHLGLIPPPGGRDRTMAQRIGDITRTLRQLAGDLELPVVLLHQLNREVERRDNKRPTMADLRDSGEIEQHADVVLGLYRPAYYERIPKDDPRASLAEVLVLKHRDGRAGPNVKAILRWNPSWVRFEEPGADELEAYRQTRQASHDVPEMEAT